MPELNANIPPIECLVRGNFLRNQIDGHDSYLPVVVFGVASIPDRSPMFHFMMEDGGIWWRAPINAFCLTKDAPVIDIHDLVMWNSFSPFITATTFHQLMGCSMMYINRRAEVVKGKYLFTLDWHSPDSNMIDAGYAINPGQHKCGHVILRDDGNYAIQPNNRVRIWSPAFTTKKGENLIDRLVNEQKWSVEDGDKWVTSDDYRYEYGVVSTEDPI